MTPGNSQRPLRVAIVGSGPAGFYAAGHLQKTRGLHAEIDVYERLPTPWGLLRAGVAPDHPDKKGVSRVFELIAAHPGLRWFGNVEVGRDVSLDALLGTYDAVILAHGAAAPRPPGLPGETLDGSVSAADFVSWYNAHPDAAHRQHDFSRSERAVVVGNGNVALDIARLLTLDPARLHETDIAAGALDALRSSRIREVLVLGRRGAEHAAFHNPELAELGHLPAVDVVVDTAELARVPPEAAADWARRRKLATLHDYAQRLRRHPRAIALRFGWQPLAVIDDGHGHVAGLQVATQAGEQRINAGLVVWAIGFEARPLAGVPNERPGGRLRHVGQRVAGLDRVYVTGWAARGPQGVIGSNKHCAQLAVDALLADLAGGCIDAAPRHSPNALLEEISQRGVELVRYRGWQRIDEQERDFGVASGRPRIKLDNREALLEVARGA
jgi:ferredoxin--NADP+ reductase